MATPIKRQAQTRSLLARFSEGEAEFLMRKRIGRLATVSKEGEPHVVPVAYEFDGSFFYIGGWNLAQTLKYKQIQANPRVALVVDDGPSAAAPWSAMGIEIRGNAEILECHNSKYIRITPEKSVSWGL